MAVRLGINGLGRIGKCVLRAALNNPDVTVAAVNCRWNLEDIVLRVKYDSVHGTFLEDMRTESTAEGDFLVVGDRRIRIFKGSEPADIPWGDANVEIVAECTGKFTEASGAAAHIHGTVKKVLISSPAKNEDLTVVMGVNESAYDPAVHHVISNASCTTNCLAPFAKVLQDAFGIKRGLMTTIHSYTNDQRILDGSHKDARRARAAAVSIIPTTTGAAKAVALVLPELKGKLNGYALRVPTPNVSVTDLVAELERPATKEEINAAFREAADGPMKGILGVSDLPLVSTDFNGDSHSSVVDADLTMVMEDNMVKVVSWYDNEWGYSSRIVDLAVYVASKGL